MTYQKTSLHRVLSARELYPFGVVIPSTYHYGFNGKENDDEVGSAAMVSMTMVCGCTCPD